MAKRGRPTLYDPDRHPVVARALAREGKTNQEICKLMGISNSTFHEWLNLHPEFADAVKNGKLFADAAVEDSLYRRATGYDCEETEIVVLAPKEGEQGKPVRQRVKRIKKHMPPDVGAAAFWLKNRKGWRDIRAVEASGPDGKPLEVSLTGLLNTLAGLTPEERQARRRELEAKLGIGSEKGPAGT